MGSPERCHYTAGSGSHGCLPRGSYSRNLRTHFSSKLPGSRRSSPSFHGPSEKIAAPVSDPLGKGAVGNHGSAASWSGTPRHPFQLHDPGQVTPPVLSLFHFLQNRSGGLLGGPAAPSNAGAWSQHRFPTGSLPSPSARLPRKPPAAEPLAKRREERESQRRDADVCGVRSWQGQLFPWHRA